MQLAKLEPKSSAFDKAAGQHADLPVAGKAFRARRRNNANR